MVRLKNFLFRTSYYIGLHKLIKYLFQRNKVTILLFHELPQDSAKAVLNFLNTNYSIISLDDYISYRINESPDKLPDYSMVLTFDDGRKSNLELIDSFKRYGNIPTIYVCAERKTLDGHDLFGENDFNLANRHFDLQAHTISHPNLKQIDLKYAKEEIIYSKSILEQKLKKNITSFAYPYGSYTQRDVQLVKEAGYTNALTADFGLNTNETSLYRLKRICISDFPNKYETAIKVCGLWGYMKKLFGYNINYSSN